MDTPSPGVWRVTLYNRKAGNTIRVSVSGIHTETEARHIALRNLDPALWYIINSIFHNA